MTTLHILTAPNGKHLLVGEEKQAIEFASKYGKPSEILDSMELLLANSISVKWLSENEILKVIHI